MGGVWVKLLGVRDPARVLFFFLRNISGMRPRSHLSSQPLTIPAPWVFLRQVFYPPGTTLGDCLLLPCGEKGGWAKTHHFLFIPSFPCFPVFSLLLTTQRYNTFECCLLELLLNNNNNNIYLFICLSVVPTSGPDLDHISVDEDSVNGEKRGNVGQTLYFGRWWCVHKWV